jgi:hypothetical protein
MFCNPLFNFDPNAKYDPKGEPAKDFLGHITLTLSRDGFVYAADRIADRIQVYTKAGKFVREFTVAPEDARSRLDRRHGALAGSEVHLCLGHHEQCGLDRESSRRQDARPFRFCRAHSAAASTGSTWSPPIRRGTSTRAKSIPVKRVQRFLVSR